MNSRAISLIILDNADYIGLSDSEFKNIQEKLLPFISVSNAHVIITTRNKSLFHDQKRITVNTFDLATSVKFLEKRTGLVQDQYSKRLAKRSGNLPIALEYSASYIATQKITYKDYLDLWDQYGIALYDQPHYTETTTRQIIHISLDKLLDGSDESAVMLEILRICAVYKMDYLPIRSYLDLLNEDYKRQTDYYRKSLEEKPYLEPFYRTIPGNNDEKLYPCRLTAVLDDGTKEFVCLIEPYKGKIFSDKKSPFIGLLLNNLKRNEIIRKLHNYSLISWDGESITIHPILAEIIRDEYMDRYCFYGSDYSIYSYDARLYQHYQDAKLAKEFEIEALQEGLNVFEKDIIILQHKIEQSGYDNSDSESIIWLTNLFQRILQVGKEDLIKRGVKDLFEYTKTLYTLDGSAQSREYTLFFERDFFSQLSWELGHIIVWRRYATPFKKRNHNGYILETTSIRDFSDSPNLESAKAAIDVWCDDMDDIDRLSEDPNWRVLAIRNDASLIEHSVSY